MDSKDKKSIDEMIERRNGLLKKVFSKLKLPIRIVGDKNKPAIIYAEEYCINAYCHNFELRFTDAPFDGQIVYTIRLEDEMNIDIDKVKKLVLDSKGKKVFKISLNETTANLYLCGYNFIDRDINKGKYPVFSAYEPRVYFNEDKANEVAKELNSQEYPVKVV